MEHLALEVFDLGDSTSSQFAVLKPDASITITDTSEIFGNGDVWSYDFTLNVHANAHLFGTTGEIHGSRLHEQIDNRKARLWVDNLPLHLGFLKLGDEAEIDAAGNIDVRIESGQKIFTMMIEGAKANQVPLLGDVRIGLALWRKRKVNFNIRLCGAAGVIIEKDGFEYSGYTKEPRPVFQLQNGVLSDIINISQDGEDFPIQEYPRMVFPKGTFKIDGTDTTEDIDCLNMDAPYDEQHPFCNIDFCYQRYGYERTDKFGRVQPDYDSDPEAQRGYEYMPANRVNSAPNFYVIYWLRCLMKHLGIHIEENEMMGVEDLRRLFFVNTNCAYREPDYLRNHHDGWTRYTFADTGRLVAEHLDYVGLVNREETGFTTTDAVCEFPEGGNYNDKYSIKGFTVTVEMLESALPADAISAKTYEKDNSYLHDAYATEQCFPNVDISEVISALESAFGIRFLFDDTFKRVRIVMLRNLFRAKDVQNISCDIVDDDVKVENNKRGFRMTYGDNDDTHFYYKGFADKLIHKTELWPDDSDKHDYSQWNLDAKYSNIMSSVTAFNKTCYVTPNTGNAYGIKVDKDAKRYNEQRPSVFEFAGFMDAEDGDCTGEEETIETISLNYAPAIVNDLNYETERDKGTSEQKFAIFVGEEMSVRRQDLGDLPNSSQPGVNSYNDSNAVYDLGKLYKEFTSIKDGNGIVKPGEFAIASDIYVAKSQLTFTADIKFSGGKGFYSYGFEVPLNFGFNIEGHVNAGYRLYLQDNYVPNDDGISPVETHDWGLTLGIMRGSGSEARVEYTGDPDDSESLSTWSVVPGGSSTSHPDTCDSYGNEWDYNGSVNIDSSSLAIEALKQLWPNSNINPVYSSGTTLRNADTYISLAHVASGIKNDMGRNVILIFAAAIGGVNNRQDLFVKGGKSISKSEYAKLFDGKSEEEMYALDANTRGAGLGVLIEVTTTPSRWFTFRDLQRLAFVPGYQLETPMYLNINGVGSRDGRFSLKLRAEKPNPYYDPKQSESDSNRRYLQITNPNLRQRGLADQFYKEYSYWIRNARIVKRTVRMTLAQLLTIDKTKRVRVGDVTGFIRKMQYTVSNEKGLGNVVMEIMYI